jgi:hypothetical protein
MLNDPELNRAAEELLDPPRRLGPALALKRVGERIRLPFRPPPGAAVIDWGQNLIVIAGVIGAGIGGNLAYDLAKAAVMAQLKRGPGSIATKDEALAVAMWAIARQYRLGPDEVALTASEITDDGAWVLTLASDRHTYRVQLPPGVPDVRATFIQRRPLPPTSPSAR